MNKFWINFNKTVAILLAVTMLPISPLKDISLYQGSKAPAIVNEGNELAGVDDNDQSNATATNSATGSSIGFEDEDKETENKNGTLLIEQENTKLRNFSESKSGISASTKLSENADTILKWSSVEGDSITYEIFRNDELLTGEYTLSDGEYCFYDRNTAAGAVYEYRIEAVEYKASSVEGEPDTREVVAASEAMTVEMPEELVVSNGCTLSGNKTVFKLTVSGGTLNLNGYALTVCKNADINGGEVVYNGGCIYCYGNFSVQYYARNRMSNANDYLYVKGNTYLNAQYNGNEFTNGKVELCCDLTTTAYSSYRPSGYSKLILSGTSRQNISLHNDNTLNKVEIRNYSADGVSFNRGFSVNELTVNDGCRLLVNGHDCHIGETLSEDLVVDGDYILLAKTLATNGHNITVNGNLFIAGGCLDVGSGSVTVTGNMAVASPSWNAEGAVSYNKSCGTLKMTEAEGTVDVSSNFYVLTDVNSNGNLKAGTLSVKGDFTVPNSYSYYGFIATAAHTVVLNGEGKQTVSISSSNTSYSRFSNLFLDNKSTEGIVFTSSSGYPLATGLVKDGDNTISGYLAVSGGTSFENNFYKGNIITDFDTTLYGGYEIGGDYVAAGSTARIQGNITVDGDVILQDGSYSTLRLDSGKLTVKGNVKLIKNSNYSYNYLYIYGGTLDIAGDLLVQSNSSYWNYVYFYGGTVDVTGNFALNGNSRAYMNSGTPALNVKGNFQMDSKGGFEGDRGTIALAGNLNCSGALTLTGTNVFVFNGESKQTVSVPDSAKFAAIELLNTTEEGVYSETLLTKQNLITNGNVIKYGSIQGEDGWTLDADMDYDKDLVLLSGCLDLNGHSLHVKGNLIQIDGDIKVGSGTLIVDGDYRIQSGSGTEDDPYGKSNGRLIMQDEDGVVSVNGDFVTQSGVDHNGCLTAGTMKFIGNFTVLTNYSGSAFVSTGSHTLVFEGESLQTVSFGSSSPSASRINNIVINNDSEDGIAFSNSSSYPTVAGCITDNGNRKISGYIRILQSTSFDGTFSGSVHYASGISITNEVSVKGNFEIVNGGTYYIRNNVSVGGDFYFKGNKTYYTYVYCEKGIVNVDGSLILEGSRLYYTYSVCLYLNNQAFESFNVGKNVSVNAYGHITGNNSVLKIGGDFTVSGTLSLSDNNKVVLNGTKKQTLSIPDNSYFATLELDNHSEDGVFATRPFSRNKLIKNGCKLSYADEHGIDDLELTEDMEYQGDLVLVEGIVNINGHKLHVTGDIIQYGGEIIVGSGSLEVDGDYRIQSARTNESGEKSYDRSSGVLNMQDADGTVLVHGSFISWTSTSESGLLTAGTMEVEGNFEISSSYTSYGFVATGTHTLVLSGTGAQSVTFGNSYTSYSYINNLRVTNSSDEGVTFVYTNTTYPLVKGMIEDEGSNVKGYIAICGSTSLKDDHCDSNLYLRESCTISKKISTNGDVKVLGPCTINVNNDVYIGGNLVVEGQPSNYAYVYINDAKLHVKGDISIDGQRAYYYGYGYIVPQKATSVLECDSNVYVRSNGYINGSNGKVQIAVNLEIAGYMNLSGNAVLCFDGDSRQNISTSREDVNFANVVIENESLAGVHFERIVNWSSFESNGNRVTFGDDDYRWGWTLTQDETIDGDVYLWGGKVDLAGHKLTINGSLIQSDGSIDVNEGTLFVKGDYRIQNCDGTGSSRTYRAGNGKLYMTKDNDHVYVGGDLYIQPKSSVPGTFSAGTLELNGKFVFVGGSYAFAATGTHTVYFSGAKTQAYESGCGCTFANVKIKDGYNVSLNNNLTITGNINGKNIGFSGGSVYVKNLNNIEGGVFTGNLYMNENTELGSDFTVNGNLTAMAILTVNGHNLYVTGNLNIPSGNNNYRLIMTKESDYVLVGNSFTMNSSFNHNGFLSAGILEIRGDFTQGGSQNFIATGTHTTILSRKKTTSGRDNIQTVTFNSYAGTTRFNKLVLKKKLSEYLFNNDLNSVANEIVYAIEDTQEPSAIEFLTADEVTEKSITITYGGAEDDYGIVGYEIFRDGRRIAVANGTSYTDRDIQPDTQYIYTVFAFDADRNMATTSPSLKVKSKKDITAPSVPQGLGIDYRTGSSVGVKWLPSSDNIGVESYNVYCNGELAGENVTSTEYKLTGLENGVVYRISVSASDKAGNESEQSTGIEVYVSMPKITRVIPADNSEIGQDSVDITVYFSKYGNSKNNKGVIEILDGEEWKALSGSALTQKNYSNSELCVKYTWDISGITGSSAHTLRCTITDEDNNSVTKEFTYYIDREAPELPTEFEGYSKDSIVELKWQPSVSADCTGYTIYKRPVIEGTEGDVEFTVLKKISDRFTVFCTDEAVVEGASYEYYITSHDKFNNESERSEVIKVDVNEDLQAPKVTSITPETGSINGVKDITVTATDNRSVGSIKLEVRKDGEEDWRLIGLEEGLSGTSVTKAFTVDTLGFEDGVYFFRAMTVDANGNIGSDDFIKRYEIDNTGISKINILGVISEASYVRIEWEDVTDKDFSFYRVEKIVDGEAVKVEDIYDKTWCYIQGLAPETEYIFRVIGYDVLGNRGIESDEVVASTVEDSTGPRILAVYPASSYYNDWLKLELTAKDDAALGYAVFSVSTDGTEFTEIEKVYDNNSSAQTTFKCDYNISGFDDGSVFIKFEAFDLRGNKNVLTEDGKDVIVEYIVDRTAPAKVQKLHVGEVVGMVEIIWDMPANEDGTVKSFNLYRAGNDDGIFHKIGNCSSLNYFDTKVDAGKTYLYKVSAIDIAGNEGDPCDEVFATVARDDEIPVVLGISPEKNSRISDNKVIKVTSRDNSGVDRVQIEYRGADDSDSWTEIATENTEGIISYVSTKWNTVDLPEGKYVIRVIARDKAGNYSDPFTAEYTLDRTAPVIENSELEAGNFEMTIHVTHNESEVDFERFELFRRVASSDEWVSVASFAGEEYVDKGLEADLPYFYKVAAYDICGNSSMSDELSGTAGGEDTERPEAIIANNTYSGFVGYEMAFDGCLSKDNVRVTRYVWDFGDGESDSNSGAIVSHTYAASGTYDLKLTVYDAAGNKAFAKAKVTIYDKSDGMGKAIIHIKDEDGVGIPYAVIYVKPTNEDSTEGIQSVKADRNGDFELIGEAGSYTVAAYQTNYLPNDIDVVISVFVDKEYTLTLKQDELIIGNLSVRRMTEEEMVSAHIDFSNPDNYHKYTFRVTLTLQEKAVPVERVYDYIGTPSGGRLSPCDTSGIPGLPSKFPDIGVITFPTENEDEEEIEPIFYYITTEQTISWLKDMYTVSLGIFNAADYKYSIENSYATLNLPDGVSLAATTTGQSKSVSMGTIHGQQEQTHTWYVRGDKRGKYSLSADFSGILMPFGKYVSATFETEADFEVTAGEGIHIYIMPEDRAVDGQIYYIQFAVVNESDHPIYDFKASFDPYDFQPTLFWYQDAETGHMETETYHVMLDDPTNASSIVLGDNQQITMKVLYPGEQFWGTYKESFHGKDMKEYYYELVDSLVEDIEGGDLGVTVTVSPILGHFQRHLYKVVPVYVGDPVDISTGAFTDSITAASVSGATDIAFNASYQSDLTNEKGEMGYGWSHDYEKYIELHNGLALFHNGPDSAAIFMNKNAAEGYISAYKRGESMVYQESKEQKYGEYISINGDLQECSLFRNEDDTWIMSFASGAEYRFDADGKLCGITDIEGRSITISHESDKTVVKDVLSGKTITYCYNSEGMVSMVYDEMGRKTYFEYDANDNLVFVTYPSGLKSELVYDRDHRIIEEKDANTVYVRNTYDSDGRVTSQTDALGNKTTYSFVTEESGFTKNVIQATVTDADGNITKTNFNSRGLTTSVVDANGGVTKYTYDQDGNMLSTADADGNYIYYLYDANGNMVGVTDACGTTTTMECDAKGNILAVVDEKGNRGTFTYDSKDRVTSSTDFIGNTVRYSYDDYGFILKEETVGLGSVTYSYENGMLKSVTDKLGRKTETSYDIVGNPVKISYADGSYVSMEYDSVGNVISVSDQDVNKTEYGYDSLGRRISETDSLGNKTTYSYDVAGNLISVKYADGSTVSYEYDYAGRVTKTIYPNGTWAKAVYDAVGNVIESSDSTGLKTTYTYDILNRCISVTDKDGLTESYEYLPNSKLHKVTFANGNTNLYTYDGRWNVASVTDQDNHITSYVYDALGNLVEMTDALGNSSTFTYDRFGQLIKQTDANGNSTCYEYDANENCIKMTDALGSSTYMEYDALDRLISAYVMVQGEKYSVSFTYDLNGNVKTYTDEEGNTVTYNYDANGNVISTGRDGVTFSEMSYDSMGRIKGLSDVLGNTASYTYDKSGNLISVLSAYNGASSEEKYEYDEIGRLVKTTSADGSKTAVTYDSYGNVLSMTDPNGGNTAYTYDKLHRLTETISPLGNKVSYSYNSQGLTDSVTNARGQKTEYTYDALGRVSSIKDELGRVDYTFDKNGNLIETSEYNAKGKFVGKISREYDALNRVTKYTDYKGNVVKYGYDELGNLISLTYSGGEIVRYEYYRNGRLKKVIDWNNLETSYTYDPDGNLLTTTYSNGISEVNTYDLAGRVTSKKTVKAAAGQEEVLVSYIYEYDARGNISKITSDSKSEDYLDKLENATFEYDAENRLIKYNGEDVLYDADGNMVYGPVDGVMTKLEFDCRNRLITAGGVSYTYDAENNRLSSSTDEYYEEYVTDTVSNELSRLLEKTRYFGKVTAGNTGKAERVERTIYLYGNGLISEEKDGSTILYHSYDHLGSTVALTDISGDVVERYTYGPYGELVGGDSSLTMFLYNGRLGVATDDNGLYYMRQRYYNPEVKRFINQDILTGSISNSQSLNRYSYVQGNPISYTDPFGLSPFSEIFTGRGLLHGILGVLGCVPGVGFIANGINAVLYYSEGDYLNGTFCLIGCLCGGVSIFGGYAAASMTGVNMSLRAQRIFQICNMVQGVSNFAQAAHGIVNRYISIKDRVARGEDISWGLESLGFLLDTVTVVGSGSQVINSGRAVFETTRAIRIQNRINSQISVDVKSGINSDYFANNEYDTPISLDDALKNLDKSGVRPGQTEIHTSQLENVINEVKYNYDPTKAYSSVYSDGTNRYIVEGHHTTVAFEMLGKGSAMNMNTPTIDLPSATNVYWSKEWYQFWRKSINIIKD